MAHRYNKRSDSSASKTNGEQSSQPSKEDEDENPHLFVYKKVRVLSPASRITSYCIATSAASGFFYLTFVVVVAR